MHQTFDRAFYDFLDWLCDAEPRFGRGTAGPRDEKDGRRNARWTGSDPCHRDRVESAAYYCCLATAHWKRNQFDEALSSLDQAFEAAERSSERFYESELHRLWGEILLSRSLELSDAAEGCFLKAIEVARNQEGLSWALRSTMSLHRLRRQQGTPNPSRQMLAEVYSRFTEGLETPDLREARQLLES